MAHAGSRNKLVVMMMMMMMTVIIHKKVKGEVLPVL
jgi:hypothetical protein